MIFRIPSIDRKTGEIAYFEFPAIAILELTIGDVRRKFVVHEGKGSQIDQTVLSDFKSGFGIKPFEPFIVEMLALGVAGADDMHKVGQYIIDRLVSTVGADVLLDKMNSRPVVNFEN
ncbi:hypothetical protein SAMN02744133_10891 [Thalassospira xiamenensis M-5 = DSM 17429]|uniref:Phage protein n=1 Tax=Thalassospira xiamenensis M-5 = DSM 17429 TaxID=1123366 RepID=A0AB72ULF3_9PROT|nr:hypothetical protein [Thalassospira xiamenensis]AJD54366.1 hypothetical protein TH3_21468 [Thalassospira xiamenensis M-5 = DSM 17429]SIT21600.1 hypothetical protein SAMN02744133_10891 [Thalassospira xiamenensis M-5 = DSM 17429]